MAAIAVALAFALGLIVGFVLAFIACGRLVGAVVKEAFQSLTLSVKSSTPHQKENA